MVLEELTWDSPPPEHCRGGAVALGNFDGVHRGHVALLAELRRQAEAAGGPAVAVTFDPPPLQLLRPPAYQALLTRPPQRAALLHAHGADSVLVLRTTPELLQVSADEFFRHFVVDRLAARAMVEGVNFAFGRNREGNVETLQRLCGQSGVCLAVVPPLEWNRAMVSSSRVRAALRQGNVREAAELLGRPYRLSGKVGTGRSRGRTLGFPTANLDEVQTLVPGEGVYAVRVHHDGAAWPGAANVGPNPTFGEHQHKVEVHVIGFHGDLLGSELAVEFIERLRDTRTFPGPEKLAEQLRHDVELARQLVTG
jgi:riboflavin kinase/FMN adenylyltransferase